MRRTWKLMARAPPPRRKGDSTRSMTGMILARSQSGGRNFRATKSSTSDAQSRLPRWMMALIMDSLQEAQNKVLRRASTITLEQTVMHRTPLSTTRAGMQAIRPA